MRQMYKSKEEASVKEDKYILLMTKLEKIWSITFKVSKIDVYAW